MKTIKLGSVALALFCIFSACTKDDLVSETNVQSTSTSKAAKTNAQNEVTSGEAVQAPAPSASFTFTPTEAGTCAYEFNANYNGGGGPGGTSCQGTYGTFHKAPECIEVNACVTAFTIDSDVSASDLGNGLYEFTINYTLISPEALSNIKFQGGATAGGNSGHAITDFGNTTVVNANNNNTVVKWEGNLEACIPQVVTFKYTRNFSCPATDATVTGNWKASVGENILGEIAPLTFSCN